MAQVDASIPLASQAPKLANPMQMAMGAYQLKAAADEDKARQTAMTQQQQMRDAFQTADLQSDEGQNDLVRKIASINPDAGMKLGQQFTQQKAQKLQMAHTLAAMNEQSINLELTKLDTKSQLLLPVIQRYESLIKQGLKPDEATAAVSKQNADAIGQFGQTFGMKPEQIQQLQQQPFNYDNARQAVMQGKAGQQMFKDELERRRLEQQEKLRLETLDREKARDAETARHNRSTESIAAKNVSTKEKTAEGGFFTDGESQLLGALAEKNVNLPAGFRSKQQQKATLKAMIERNPDKSPDQIAQLVKDGKLQLTAETKEVEVAGRQAGRIQLAANEIEEFSKNVEDAIGKIDRNHWMPVNKLLNMADEQLQDPALRNLKVQINSVLNAADQLAARGGTDKDKRAELHRLLTAADSPEVVRAALNGFKQEAAAAKRAAAEAAKVGQSKSGESKASPPKAGDVMDGYKFKGGDPSKKENWEKV
jgi:hypothetical protein